MKNALLSTDIIMKLKVPAKKVMQCVAITLFHNMTLSNEITSMSYDEHMYYL